tara:strand:+ start:596 stop:1402 length:807 start_codon:yes stop_codon:yes gene_type:complete
MSKGFLWFCQNNNETDYVELSISLARSIKKFNKENNVCVITDTKTKIDSSDIDVVKVLTHDESETDDIKWGNEYKAFSMSPFTHTIKLAADMLWTKNTDWWWYSLWKHDMIFSVDCYNYRDQLVKDKKHRPHHARNMLPNIYSDLTYFRRSSKAVKFGKVCEAITKNWKIVCETMLVNCHDRYPSTDIVYALANRIIDPAQQDMIDFPWFKIIHNKKHINGLQRVADQSNYLSPVAVDDKLYLGGYAISRPWHYVDKNTNKEMHARIF